jgi:hypothetical protein
MDLVITEDQPYAGRTRRNSGNAIVPADSDANFRTCDLERV